MFDATAPKSPASTVPYRVEDAVVHTLVDLANNLSRGFEPVLKEHGLSVPQWMVLLQVLRDPNFPTQTSVASDAILASQIAGERSLSRAHISGSISELLRKGLIEQHDDARDRRRKRLTVTNAGQRVAGALLPVQHEMNDRLLDGLDDPQRKALLDILLKLRWRGANDDKAPDSDSEGRAARHG